MIIEAIVFIICMAGSSYQAYRIGLKLGAEFMLDRLHDAKVISYVGDEIVPNKFFLDKD